MKRTGKIRGFYGVIDSNDEYLTRRLVSAASAIQVRMKTASLPGIAQAARMARRITQTAGVLLIVNDHLDIALEVGADGVHLGQTDMPVSRARELARQLSGFIIGVSTHSEEQVRAAISAGADYIGYGPVYATETKDDPDPVRGLEALRKAVEAAGDIPVVAIGGITAERARDVALTGAAAACAIGAVNGAKSPEQVAGAIAACWTV